MSSLLNMVRVVSTTTGTGTVSLGAVVDGFLTMTQAGGVDGTTYSYAIEGNFDSNGAAQDREQGTGVWSSGANTLTRNVVNSTNGNALLNLTGDEQVFITPLASDFGGTPGGVNGNVQYNSSGTFAADGSFTYSGNGTAVLGSSAGTGALNLKGATSGTVSVSVSSAAGSWTMKLPTSAGTNTYLLQTDGSGNTTWVSPSAVSTPGGSNTQVQYNSSGTFAADGSFTYSGNGTATLGSSAGTGLLNLKGVTSGTVSVSVSSAAGTWTMKLPTTAGTNTYLLQTDGSGNTSWVAPTSGTPGGNTKDIQYNSSGAFAGSDSFQFDTTNANAFGLSDGTVPAATFAGFPVQFSVATTVANNWMSRFAAYGNSGYSVINLYTKTRGAGPDAVGTAVQSGDDLAEWRSYGDDGSAFRWVSTLRTSVSGAVSAGVVPTSWSFLNTDTTGALQNPLFLAATGQTQFTIDDNNTNGITSPMSCRHILFGGAGSGTVGIGVGHNFVIMLDAGNVEVARFAAVATAVGAGVESADLRLSNITAGTITEKFRIDSTGNVWLMSGSTQKGNVNGTVAAFTHAGYGGL